MARKKKKRKAPTCGACSEKGHTKRSCSMIAESDVIKLFEAGGYTINERFPECGFVYFPTCPPYTKENESQGRVFFTVEEHARDNGNNSLGLLTEEDIHINVSWGRPNDKQVGQLYKLVTLYVNYCREQKFGKLSPLEQLASQA